MNIKALLWQLALIAAALSTSANPALAQTCFQKVGGVPGAYSQPPDWWSGGAAPLGSMTGSFVDDPRWQGATSISHISDSARFRALVETVGANRFLVLSWRVKADPSGDADRLYVGFWDETSNQGNVFRLEKGIGGTATPVAGSSYADGAFNGRFFHRIGATGNAWALNNAASSIPPPLPDWLKNDTRVDVFCPGGTCSEWAIRMRVPIDPAADVASDNPTGVKITAGGVFRFWYQIQESTSVGTGVLYGYPEGLGPAQEGNPPCTSIPPYCFPDPLDSTNSWVRVQDGGTCTGDISIAPSHIYANSPGSITVNLSSPNDFHARPLNNTSGDQPGNAIKATFRLANWGSALFSSPGWTPICSDVLGAAGTVAGSGQFDVTCTWSVPDPCAFKPMGDPCGPTSGSRNVDQCILVDLAAAPGGGPYHFSPQSAWRNMLFTGASTVTKLAELDTRGATPLPAPAPNRDLYVYVDARNMPVKRSPEDPPVDVERLPGDARERLAKLKIRFPQAGGIGRDTASAIAAAMAAGRLSSDEVAALMPTYMAYVWHDTGRTMVGPAGTPLKILSPQPAFGLFLWHDGALHGWRHRFEGSTITELEPNYYRVSAPTDGTVKVTTTVTACEDANCGEAEPEPEPEPTPEPEPPVSKWWIVLLVLLALVLLFFLLRKKSSGP